MKYANMLLALFEKYREEQGKTYGFWADRWTKLKREHWRKTGRDMSKFRSIHPATVARWAKCDRRIGPNNTYIFDDPLVPFTMDQYYRDTPVSDQTNSRSHVRVLGRTRAKSKLRELAQLVADRKRPSQSAAAAE